MVAERLSLEASTPLFFLERLRLASDRPLALDRVWMPAEVGRPLLERRLHRDRALRRSCAPGAGSRLTGGREHLRAVVPTPAERPSWRCRPAIAAFAIERLGFDGGSPLEWRHTLVRGDRFAVSAEFTRPAGYPLSGGSSVDR